MRKCHECEASSVGVFCLIDFILIMKEVGWDSDMIRRVYRYGIRNKK